MGAGTSKKKEQSVKDEKQDRSKTGAEQVPRQVEPAQIKPTERPSDQKADNHFVQNHRVSVASPEEADRSKPQDKAKAADESSPPPAKKAVAVAEQPPTAPPAAPSPPAANKHAPTQPDDEDAWSQFFEVAAYTAHANLLFRSSLQRLTSVSHPNWLQGCISHVTNQR